MTVTGRGCPNGDLLPEPWRRSASGLQTAAGWSFHSETEFSNDDAQFCPDGRYVAYVSDESGRNGIDVRTFSPDAAGAAANGDGKWLVSTAGGNEPRWSGDGKTLYYIAPDAKLMAAQITASSGFQAGLPKTLFQTPANMSGSYRRSWDLTPNGKRFLFIVQTEQRTPPFNVILNWSALLGIGTTLEFPGERIVLSVQRLNFWGNALSFRYNA